MNSYKDPSFQDRVARAAKAKQKALDALRAKPAMDEKTIAARQARRLKREAAEKEKREARQAAAEAAGERKAAKAKAAEAQAVEQRAAEAKAAPVQDVRTEAEKKLARDARYAARKSRK